jgi:hypothetical protein
VRVVSGKWALPPLTIHKHFILPYSLLVVIACLKLLIVK